MPSDVLITPASSKIEFTDGANATKTLKITGTSLNTDTSFAIGATTANNTLSVLGSASIGSSYNVAGPTNGLIVQGSTGIGTTSPTTLLQLRQVSATHQIFSINRANSATPALFLGNDSSDNALIASNNTALRFGKDFTGTFNEYVRIDTNGNVGIGTTSPGVKLDVIGGIRSFSSAGNYGLITNGSFQAVGDHGGTFMLDLDNTGAADLVNIKKSGTSRFYIKNDGNVGIGATSPIYKLEVIGDARISGGIINPSLSAQWTLSGGGTVTYNGSAILWSNRVITIPVEKDELSTTGYIDINCPTSGTITYYNSGNGISTVTCAASGIPIGIWEALYYEITPGQTQASDQTKFRLVNYQNSTWRPSSNWLLICAVNGDASSLKWIPGQVIIPTNGSFDSSNSTNNWQIAGTTNYIAKFTSANKVGNSVLYDNGANIGVGTASPAYKLDVSGIIASVGSPIAWFSGNYNRIYEPAGNPALYLGNNSDPTNYYDNSTHYFRSRGGGTNYAIITSSGNVGIGTSNPAAKLDIVGTNTTIALSFGTTVPNNPLFINTYGGYAGVGMDQTTAGIRLAGDYSGGTNPLVDIGYYTSGSVSHANWISRLKIINNGNVGIGSTLPAYKLDVAGRISYNGAIGEGADTTLSSSGTVLLHGNSATWTEQRFYTSGTQKATINTSGNLGIGTTTVSYKLHVQGDIYARSAVTNTSTDLNSLRGNVTTMGYSLTNSPSGAGWITVYTSQNFLSSGDILSQLAYDNYNQQKLFTRYSADYGATWSAWKTIINSDALSGTTNYIPKFTGTNSIGNSLIFDNGTNVAIGSNAVAYGRLQISATGTSPSLSSTNPTDASLIISNSDIAYGTMFATYGDGKGALQQRRTNAATYYDFSLQPHGGNLGIGTLSPTQKLEVAGIAMAGSGSYRTSIYGDNGGAYLYFGTTANASALGQIGAYGALFNINSLNNDISFQYNSSEKMRITTSGNVGIGTTTPSYKLHVSQAIPTGTTSAPANTSIQVDSNTNNYLSFVNTADNGTYAGLTFVDNNVGGYIVFRNYTGDVNAGSDSLIYGTYQDHIFQTGTTSGVNTRNEVLRIKNNGNIGINQNSPSYKLDVNGTGRFASDLTTNGNIVIARAGAYLYINGTNSDAEIIWQANGSNRWAAGMNVGDATENFNIYNYTSTSINFTILKSNGNIGIGAATPNNKLHVNGSMSIGSGYNTAGPTNGLIVQGNVGIGTSNPSTYASQLALETTQTRAITAFNPSLADTGTLYGLGFGYALSNYNSAFIGFYKAGAGSTSNRISFSLWNQNDILNINGAGNVGIGTTVPLAQLHINETISGAEALRVDGTNGTLFSVVDDLSDSLMSVNNSAGLPVLEVFADDRVVAGQYGANDLVVRNNRVGIGTSNPSYALDVQSNIGVEPYSQARFLNTNTSTPYGGLIVNGTSQAHIRFLVGSTTWGGSGAKQWQIRVGQAAGTDALSIYSWTTGNDVLYINSSGNVGINSTNPTTKLYVTGSITALDGSFISNVTSGTDRYFLNCYGTSANQIFSLYENSTVAYLNSYNTMALRANQNGGSGGFITLTGGNVGVGGNPSYRFDVNAGSNQIAFRLLGSNADTPVIRFENTGASGRIYHVGSTLPTSGAGGGFTIYDVTASASRVLIDANGNVGIGQTSPVYKLDVNGTFNASGTSTLAAVSISGTITSSATEVIRSNNNNGYISIYNSAGTTRTGYIQGLTGSSLTLSAENGAILQFNVNGSEKVRIATDGNVGIGQASPNAKLNVVGASNTDAGVRGGTVHIRDTTASSSPATAGMSGVVFSSSPGTDWAIGKYWSGTTSRFVLKDAGSALGTNLLSVDANGNVGLGVDSPAQKLEVNGVIVARNYIMSTDTLYIQKGVGGYQSYITAEQTSAGTGNSFKFWNSGTATLMTISYDGNVGIGTTSPAAKLQVIAGNSPAVSAYSNNSGQYAYIQIGRTSSELEIGVAGGANQFFTGTVAGDATIKQNSTGKLHLGYGSGAPAITINSSNNVGVGTTIPATLLQINTGTPTAATGGIQFGDDTSARIYRGASGYIYLSGGLYTASSIQGASYLQSSTIYANGWSQNLVLNVSNSAGNAWITGITIAPGGNVTVAGTLTESSSIRYKENIETIDAPILPKLNKIRPVSYNKKDNKNFREYGIIAEELNELFPEFVNKNENGEIESVNYSRLTVILIKAVKELQEEVERLKNK